MNSNFSEAIEKVIAGKDPSEFLHTRKLMNSWYCLADEDVTVVVDSTRPRIFRLYTHGELGDFQDLLYDVDKWAELTGDYGIVPGFEIDGQRAMPFIPHAYCFHNFGKGKAIFEPDTKTVQFSNLDCYVKGDLNDMEWSEKALDGYDETKFQKGFLDFRVQLDKHNIMLNVKYPPETSRGFLNIGVYPVYTHYAGPDGKEHAIEYTGNYGIERNYSPYFNEVIGNKVVLRDHHGVVPEMAISSRQGACRLVSRCDSTRCCAYELKVIVETESKEDEIRISLAPNPLNMKIPPVIMAGKPTKIKLLGKTATSLKIDDEPVRAKLANGYAEISLDEGEHQLKAISERGFTARQVWATKIDDHKVQKMADCLMGLFWQDENKKDIMAYAYDPITISPTYREGAGFIVHTVRSLTTLLVAARRLRKPEYAEQVLLCLDALARRSHKFDNGDLLLTIWLDTKGQPMLKDACRPSDLGIMTRTALYASRCFRQLGDKEKSQKCLDYATRYARTLLRMQREDGAFHSRYRFPDLTPTSEMLGTVNNWIIQVWDLADEISKSDPETAEQFRAMLHRYADYCINRENSILEVTGGADEGPANYHDDLATASAVLAIKYALTGEEQYKECAKQAFTMSFICRSHRLDSPTHYMYYLTPHCGPFYDYPNGLGTKGDMTCLTGNEAGLFLKRLLDFDLGEYAALWGIQASFTDSFMPNGAICSAVVRVPNYQHKVTLFHSTNVYGAVGVVLTWLLDNYC